VILIYSFQNFLFNILQMLSGFSGHLFFQGEISLFYYFLALLSFWGFGIRQLAAEQCPFHRSKFRRSEFTWIIFPYSLHLHWINLMPFPLWTLGFHRGIWILNTCLGLKFKSSHANKCIVIGFFRRPKYWFKILSISYQIMI
jgi:hypothetical protein